MMWSGGIFQQKPKIKKEDVSLAQEVLNKLLKLGFGEEQEISCVYKIFTALKAKFGKMPEGQEHRRDMPFGSGHYRVAVLEQSIPVSKDDTIRYARVAKLLDMAIKQTPLWKEVYGRNILAYSTEREHNGQQLLPFKEFAAQRFGFYVSHRDCELTLRIPSEVHTMRTPEMREWVTQITDALAAVFNEKGVGLISR